MPQKTPADIIETWVSHFGPSVEANGKQFDAGMEAASLALALESAGYAIVPIEDTIKKIARIIVRDSV